MRKRYHGATPQGKRVLRCVTGNCTPLPSPTGRPSLGFFSRPSRTTPDQFCSRTSPFSIPSHRNLLSFDGFRSTRELLPSTLSVFAHCDEHPHDFEPIAGASVKRPHAPWEAGPRTSPSRRSAAVRRARTTSDIWRSFPLILSQDHAASRDILADHDPLSFSIHAAIAPLLAGQKLPYSLAISSPPSSPVTQSRTTPDQFCSRMNPVSFWRES